MAKLSLTFLMNDDDWRVMIESEEGRWSPEILRGSVALSLGGFQISDIPEAAVHLEGDRITGVVLGTFLLELLKAAKSALEHQRGTRQVTIDGTDFLISFTSLAQVIRVEVRIAVKGLIRKSEPVLAQEIPKAEFAQSILAATEPLVKRFEFESARPLVTSTFIRELNELLGDISRHARPSHES
jgi:hypothetical protein